MAIRFAVVAAFAACSASGDLIDFETLPGGGLPADDAAIGNAYNIAEFNFVTFAVSRDNGLTLQDAVFEAVGEESSNGYVYDQGSAADVEADSFAGPFGLGQFFLRDDRDVTGNGGPLSLFITYNQADQGFAPTEASGQIWDIDGNSSQGTEKWDVIVTDVLGNVTVAATSPEGTSNGASSLDGLPWMWLVEDLDGIAQIELRFTGTKQTGLGVAFDNFNTDTIPAPASFALVAAGGVVAGRRRK